jgi:hypothetical protein
MAAITRENIGTVREAFTHITDRRSKAKPGATRVVSARSNGAVKTWVTRPAEFRAPFKYGLRDCFYITPDNAHQWFTTAEDAAAAPARD